MSKNPKSGWVPSPLFSDWWGPLADQVWNPAFRKHGPAARRKKPHSTDVHRSPKQKCPCESFTICDLSYQNMSGPDKSLWKAALKKPGMSAYELYMKECLSTAMRTATYPECPSVSGGFSCGSVIAGAAIEQEGFIGLVPPPPPPEPWPGGPLCARCPGDSPSVYTTLIEGLVDDGSYLNGTYDIPFWLNCIWRLNIGNGSIYVSRGPGPYDQLTYSKPGRGNSLVLNLTPGAEDCYSERIIPWSAGTGIFAGQYSAIATISGYKS